MPTQTSSMQHAKRSTKFSPPGLFQRVVALLRKSPAAPRVEPLLRHAGSPRRIAPPSIQCGHVSHNGLRRPLNEDAFFASAELGLWLVADGMGGRDHGEVASAMAREVVVSAVRKGLPLDHAVRVAHESIFVASRHHARRRSMATTIVAMRLRAGAVLDIAWVGDSRIYRHRPTDGLKQLSSDHSMVQEWVDWDVITAAEARRHPMRNMLTQALGTSSHRTLNIGRKQELLLPGTQFLLCSDGLTNEVDDSELASLLGQATLSAQECADRLLDAALGAGGADNITAVLVRAVSTSTHTKAEHARL